MTAGSVSPTYSQPVLNALVPTPTAVQAKSKIAYTANWSIYVMAEDGSSPHCLTICNQTLAGTQASVAPAWSRDGQQIAFKGYRDDPEDYVWGIFLINVDGSNLRRLADDNPCSTNVTQDAPTWSPDDSQLAFVTCQQGKTGLYVINTDGKNLKLLADLDAGSPAWSPDGSLIAFNSGPHSISVINSDGSNLQPLTTEGSTPAWSPDGTQLAYIAIPAKPGAMPSVAVMNANGSHMRTIYHGSNFVDSPSWSPDGQYIAFMSQPDEDNDSYYDGNVYRIKVDGTDLRQLTRNGGLWPAWSPLLQP